MEYKEKIEEKRRKLVNTLIEFIENNPTQWEAGWYKVATEPPFNGKSEKAYKGLNAFYLCVLSMLKGYRDPRWVTFKQAKELGGNVKSGEKSSEIFYWSFYDKATKKSYEEKTCEGMTKKERLEYWEKNVRPVIKFYQVFNAEQCENLPEYKRETTPEMEAEERKRQNAVIEQIIANSDAPVNYDGGNRAYYSPTGDSIHLPAIKDFKTMQDYYATALHEIAHSTGHASRLNRNLLGFFGTAEYAKEELRAELASVFMQVEYGISIEGKHFENHGAYLAGWLKSVKDNKNDFFAAATDAERITSYIADNYLQNIKEPKFEANNSFARQVDAVLSGADTTSTHLKIMGTPLLLRQLGAQNIPVLMTAKHLKNIVADSGDDNEVNYHGLDVDLIKKLPELISDPVMVMDSLTRDDSVVIVTSAVDKENRPILGAIKFDGLGRQDGKIIEANILASVYGKDNFENFIRRNVEAENVLYWSKEKSQDLSVNPGFQLPDVLASLGSNIIIRKAKAFVNSLDEKNINIPVVEAKKAEERNAKTEQAIDKMSDNVVISSEVLATRQEMLNIIWSGYGNDYYAVSNEKILIPDEDDERDNGFIEVDGQAVYVIDEYGSIQQNQVGQKLTSYDININLPYYSQRDYKQIPLEDLQRIADERAAKITAYAQALKEVERKSEKPVHNDLYFLEIAKQELDKHYADFHSVEPFYGKYMRTQVDNPEAIVLKRVGDFYEAMGDKAAQVAATLDLTLTGRDVGLSDRVAMCGFPYHAADEYISKLRESSDVIVDDKYLVKSSTNNNDNANNESSVQNEEAQQVGQVEQTMNAENTKQSNLYYPINEDAARRAKQANSFDDYMDNSATAEYQRYVDEAKRIADFQKTQVEPIYHEKIDRLLDTYARNLARNMNARFDIDSRVPSVMISGAGNFPVRQKEKQNAAREKNWEEWKRISEIPEKISTIGKGGIQSSEPNALEKLEKKVAELEKSQDIMKQVNAYYRKNKTLDDCPYLPKEQLDKLKAEMAKSWHDTVPFQSFALSNNNAEIKRIKVRIEELRETKDGRYVGWEFDGGKVEASSKDMRLQIFFDEKPNSEKRAELKKAGFRWSPTVGAWQRQLNENAIYAANGVKFIQPMNGESPSDLQHRVRVEKEILKEARKAAHEAGLPFSDKFDIGEEDFNPNVYDGSMSIEDYKIMNEMIAAEQAEQVGQVAPEQGNKPTVVNFYAGPGAGKTTAALELTAELKKVGLNVEYVSEYAKELVLEGKTELLSDQQHVTDEQYHRLDRLRNSVDVIVTDSPVLLGIVYGADRIDDAYRQKLRSYYDSFDNIDIYLERSTVYDTKGRVQSEEEAVGLDKAISQMLEQQNIYCHGYSSEKIAETVQLAELSQVYRKIRAEAQKQSDLIAEARIKAKQIAKETGEPYVTINWSEHSSTNPEGIRLNTGDIYPLSEADKILEKLNADFEGSGYAKTKLDIDFVFECKMESWEACRFDIGTEPGGLVAHIMGFAAYATEQRHSPQEYAFIKAIPKYLSEHIRLSNELENARRNGASESALEHIKEERQALNAAVPFSSYKKQVRQVGQTLQVGQVAEEKAAVTIAELSQEHRKMRAEAQKESDLIAEARIKAKLSPREYYMQRNAERLDDIDKNVPSEMKTLPNWCVFKTYYDKSNGKKKKVILSPNTGEWAKCNDASTWASYKDAMAYARENGCEGLSFALNGQSRITCVDLDHCIDDKGMRSELCWKVLNASGGTYAEKSISGRGVHVFFKADGVVDGYNKHIEAKGLECYDTSKFMSVTGNSIGKTNEVKEAPKGLIELLHNELGKSVAAKNAAAVKFGESSFSNAELIEKIRCSRVGDDFERMMNGEDICGDRSRTDAKLMSMLAFFTNCDPAQMKSVFMESGLYRPEKGDKYIDRTIEFVISTLSARPQRLGAKKSYSRSNTDGKGK